jgi:hypothetical protein
MLSSFETYFRELYATFGYPLTEKHALSRKVLTAAERRLGVRVPIALRDFYLVAGGERRFNHSFNRILSPRDWEVDKQRLIFMDENQVVVRWGVSLRNASSADPPISQGVNGETIAWYPEHRKLSVFLSVMLHYNAVNGGFRFCDKAEVSERAGYRLGDHGWKYRGEVNSLRAYSRPNGVLCTLPPGDLPFMNKWTALIGGKTHADLRAVADELGVAVRA